MLQDMAATVPSSEPTTIVAGDTIAWTKSLDDFKATDGWSLSYAFRYQNGAGLVDVTASTVGADFSSLIAATESAKMKPGIWLWAAYATKAAERYQVGTGSTTVSPNLAKLDSSADLRTPAKIAYDNALQAWQGVKLGQTVMLNGRTYTQHNLKDLIVYVDRCKSDYALEVAAQNPNGSNPRHIGVRLSRV